MYNVFPHLIYKKNNKLKIGKDLKQNKTKKTPTIALNVLYIKGKEICPAFISKINSNWEKQIILLMIPNEEKEGWHCLAVKKLSALLTGTSSKPHGDFIV